MPFFVKSQEEMISRGLEAIRNGTNITQLSPGSKTRFLLDAMVEEQASQHQLFDSNLAQAFIRWCDAKYLDFFGDMLNIPRLNSQRAEVNSEENNFLFYVDGGTFGDINSGNDIVIPSGTIVSTPDLEIETRTYEADNENSPVQQVVEYQLRNSVTCPANKSFVYATIRARIEGSNSDVPRNVLRKHNFINYTISKSERLKCTNKYAIANGRERETDGSYKYRLMNAFKARERANRLAIRLAALSIAGVSDTFEFNCEQGPGTFSLYVEALTPTTSPTLLNNVREAVTEVCSFGVRPFILAPNPLGVEFVAAIQWARETTEDQKKNGYGLIRDAVENYMYDIKMATNLDLQIMAKVVASASQYIQGIGLQRSGEFEEIYIYRYSPDNIGVRKTLFTESVITPLYNERIILETNTNDRGIIFI